MERTKYYFWFALLIVPLIPVVLLYLLFREANYFDLKDEAKGIVAAGPIAAYIVIVYLGLNVFTKLSRLGDDPGPYVAGIVGEWSFKSTSVHDHLRHGDFTVRTNLASVAVSGTFVDGDSHLGNWESQMVRLTEHGLDFFYELKEMGAKSTDGICRLSFVGGSPIARMDGIWMMAAHDPSYGSITCARKALPAKN